MTCESRINHPTLASTLLACGQPAVATVYGTNDDYRLPVCERHAYRFACLIADGRMPHTEVVRAAVAVPA